MTNSSDIRTPVRNSDDNAFRAFNLRGTQLDTI